MNVSVVGSGYVGLVTAAGLAEKGHQVTCVDTDAAKVDGNRRGVTPFHEPGLEELLRRNRPRLGATTDLRRAVLESDVSFIAVGTPFAHGAIDLAAVRAASSQIGAALREKPNYHLVVVKSTVVPGTTEDVVGPLNEQASGKRAGLGFGLAANPEFLTEGEAVRDFMYPDRLVLGALDATSLAGMEELYAGFDGTERLRTNPRTAEMIKYAANCLLATAISFSNEIANLCAALGGIDAAEVMRGVHASRYLTITDRDGRHHRAELASFLWAGCGFGGSCLPKDLGAVIGHGQRAGQPMALLRAVVEINQRQPEQIIALVRKHFPSLRGVHVAILGLAFRQGTSDMRESPAVPIIRHLLAGGATVSAYDPAAREEATKVFDDGSVRLCEDLQSAVAEADAVVLVTRWEEFRGVPDALRATGRHPLLVDGRRMLERTTYDRYEGIGL
jgi:UDPglucose 6-dehydrogenase